MFWCAAAFAGELAVVGVVPVNVWVDGNYVPLTPGTTTAQLSGVAGVHRVQVGAGDQLLGEVNVQVPLDGARTVTWDGVSLVVTQPAPTQVVVLAPPPAPVQAPAPTGPTAMSPSAFGGLLGAVQSGTYADDQLSAIRTAASKNWFTIDQVAALVDAMTYGSDQVTAVQLCAPKVVDPENAFSLASHFTYSSDKEAALALFR